MPPSGIAGSFGAEQGGAGGPFPRRPAIPAILVVSLALWASCAAVLPALADGAPASCAVPCAASTVAAGIACIALWRLGRGHLLLLAALGAFLGVAVASGHAVLAHARAQELAAHPRGDALLMAVEDSSPSDFGSRCAFRIRYPDGAEGRVEAYLDAGEPQIYYGQLFSAEAAVSKPSGSARAWQWRTGSAGTAELSDLAPLARDDPFGWIADLRIRAIRFIGEGGDGDGVLRALACGFTPAFDASPLRGDFAACGLAHIVAVSGAHLMIVGSLVGVLLGALRLPRGACAAVQVLVMSGYLVLAGCPVSALRAFAMAVALQAAPIARRRGAGLASLGVCIAVMVSLDATVALSASFALSALSTLGIGLFFGLLSSWVRAAFAKLPSVAGEALALTVASSILAQPLSCALFSQLPLVSVLANVLVAPLVAPLCAADIAAGLLGSFSEAAGAPALFLARGLGDALCAAVRACAALPYASIPVSLPQAAALLLSFAAVCSLWALWPAPAQSRRASRRKAAAALAAMLAFALATAFLPLAFHGETRLVMLDVGQGDAFLLRSAGRDVLVDTGASGTLLKQALARQNVRSLDAVLLTHADDDHCGALPDLEGFVRVSRVLVAADALECPCASCREMVGDARDLAGPGAVAGLEVGDAVAFGRFSLKVIWPERFEDEGGNADSLCLDVSVDADGDGSCDARALMTGDAEAKQLHEMLEGAPAGGYDVLKVGHHGSRASLDEEALERIAPRIALVSVGEGNRYGHPADSVMVLLEGEGVAVYRTDERGDVSCRFSQEGVAVDAVR